MRRIFLTFLLVAGYAFAFELITNGSFEAIGDNGYPLKWRPNGQKARRNVHFEVEQKGAPDGQNCAVIFTDDPAIAPTDFIAWIQDIDLKLLGEPYPAGQEVALTLEFTCDQPGTAIRAYVEGRAMGNGFNAMGGSSSVYVGWKKYEVRFCLPKEKPDLFYVVVQLLSPGRAKFDKVSIAPVTAPTPVTVENKKAVALTELGVRFHNLPPQATFVIGQTPRILNFTAKMGADKYSEMLAEIAEFDSGKVVAKQRFTPIANKIDAAWHFPELPAGVYRLTCRAQMAGRDYAEDMVFRVATPEEVAAWRLRVQPNHTLTKDGKPYFPIGVCPPYHDLTAWKAYQMAGFNVLFPHINASSNTAVADYYFKHAAELGLDIMEWVNLMDSSGMPTEKMAAYIKNCHDIGLRYPNFIGWLNDENAWRGLSVEAERKCYQLFFRYMPGVLCWNNQAPRGTVSLLRRYAIHTDVTGADVYPIPDNSGHSEMPRKTIACVGDYVDDFMEACNQNIPVWMILQAWSWSDTLEGTLTQPNPSFEQLRFMFYNAITHGATGIAWFGQLPWNGQRGLNPMSPVMKDLARVNLEFRAVEELFLTGENCAFLTPGDDTADLRILERNGKSGYLAIIVNERPTARKAAIRSTYSGQLFDTLEINRKLADGRWNFEMKPFEVIILSSRKIAVNAPADFPKLEKTASLPLADAVKTAMTRCPTTWRARWFWNEPMKENAPYSTCQATHTFQIDGDVSGAWLCVGADNSCTVLVNGQKVCECIGWSNVAKIDIGKYLKLGKNTLVLDAENVSSFGGLIFEGEIATSNGVITLMPSEEDTRITSPDGKRTIQPVFFSTAPSHPWGNIHYLP